VNVSAYALRLGGVPQIEALGDGTTRETVSVLNFAAVPVGFSSLQTFGPFSGGFGVFVPQMEVTGLRTRVTLPLTAEQSGRPPAGSRGGPFWSAPPEGAFFESNAFVQSFEPASGHGPTKNGAIDTVIAGHDTD
jgi:hypothetical protein